MTFEHDINHYRGDLKTRYFKKLNHGLILKKNQLEEV